MQVLGVVGPSDAGRTTLVTDLVARVAERGPVGTITRNEDTPADVIGDTGHDYRQAGATRTLERTTEGWIGTGQDRTLDEALAALSPRVEYAIVDDHPDATLPQVVLGDPDQEPDGQTIARASHADAIDLDDVLDRLETLDPYETLASLIERATDAKDADRAGAVATFTGRVRKRDSPEDSPTEYLEFQRYDDVAAERMATIETDLQSRDGVYDVQLHHRTGVVEAGEDIVFVVVLAGHRKEAFRAVEDGIDRLKAEVPLFKKEVTVEEEFWVHEGP